MFFFIALFPSKRYSKEKDKPFLPFMEVTTICFFFKSYDLSFDHILHGCKLECLVITLSEINYFKKNWISIL